MTFPHSKRTSRLLKQNVRMITGQVLANNNVIVGACFVIHQYEYGSRQDTMLVTSHNVIDRIVNGEFERDTQVQVKFPQVQDTGRQVYFARLTKRDPASDIAILSIRTDIQSKLPSEIQIAEISDAKSSIRSEPNRFVSYGYRQANDYRGLPVRGHIRGDGEVSNPYGFMLLTPHVSDGMSGAPVLDWENDLVVGMITIPKHEEGPVREEKTATAIDLHALSEPKLLGKDARHILVDKPNTRIHPRININPLSHRAANRIQTNLEPHLPAAPKLPEQTPVLREFMFKRLIFDWNQEYHYLVGLVGVSGAGKTVLARQFVDHIYQQENPPAATFWWNFRAFPSISHFIESALNYFLGYEEAASVRNRDNGIDEMQVLASIIMSRRVLFILDGFEKMLSDERETYGLIGEDRDRLKRFLDLFTILLDEHNSMCIILSNMPLVDMVARRAYYEYSIFRLDPADSAKLLGYLRPSATKEWQQNVIKAVSGHALSLALTAGLIKQGNDDITVTDEIPRLGGSVETYIASLLSHYHHQHDTLTDDVIKFLLILSIFRVPVKKTGIWDVWYGTYPAHESTRLPPMTLADKLLEKHIIKETQDEKLLLHHLIVNYFYSHFQQEHKEFYNLVREQTGRYFAQLATRANESEGMRRTFIGEAIHHLNIEVENKEWLNIEEFDPNLRLIGQRYLLINKVGKGGFGIVYRAYDINTRRYRAVKVIEKTKKNMLSGNLKQAQDEIAIISEIQQPNIIPVLDYSNDPKEFYIVMPLMEGGSLTDKIGEKRSQQIPFANEDIFKIISDIGIALDRVHNREVIHRDVSPNNIIFNTDGDPYLIDFGLAKAIEDQPNKDNVYARVGTRYYSANESPTKRSDQYSLATIALEMLTLFEPPELVGYIQGEEIETLIDKAIHLPVLLKDKIKPTLAKALSIDEQNRFDDIITFVKVLEENYRASKIHTDPTVAIFDLAETDPGVFESDSEEEGEDLLKTNIPLDMWSAVPPSSGPLSDTDLGSGEELAGQSLDDTGIGPEFGMVQENIMETTQFPALQEQEPETVPASETEPEIVTPEEQDKQRIGIVAGIILVVAILVGGTIWLTGFGVNVPTPTETINPSSTTETATPTSDVTSTPTGVVVISIPQNNTTTRTPSSEVEETDSISPPDNTDVPTMTPSNTPTHTDVPTRTPSTTPTKTDVPTRTPSNTPTITPTPRRADPIGDAIDLLEDSLDGVVIIQCNPLQEAYTILVDYKPEFSATGQTLIDDAIRDEGLNQGSIAEAKSRCDATSSGQIYDEFLLRTLSDFADDLEDSSQP